MSPMPIRSDIDSAQVRMEDKDTKHRNIDSL